MVRPRTAFFVRGQMMPGYGRETLVVRGQMAVWGSFGVFVRGQTWFFGSGFARGQAHHSAARRNYMELYFAP